MYVCQIPVKLDRNTFRSAMEVGFRPGEKAEHQGCCDRIPSESGWNRNPALDSGTPKTGTKASGMCNLASGTTMSDFPAHHSPGNWRADHP